MSVSASRPTSEAFQIDVHTYCHVATLPASVRRKWRNSEPSKETSRDTTHADLDFRLQKAEERRAQFRNWYLRKRPRSTSIQEHLQTQRDYRAKKLEQKLADAEANRRSCLESVRSKATAMLQRQELVAERFQERQILLAQKLSETLSAAQTRRLALLEAEKERLSAAHELVSSRKVQVQEKEEQERAETRKLLGAKLDQADSVRLAKLAATAAKAGDKVRHAKHVSKMRRLNEEKDAEQKRSYLSVKLQTAEKRRYEDWIVRVVINAEKSETRFLKSQATKKEKLRRSGTSRRLQMFWRSFRDSNKTTKELAEKFLHSGVTFLNISEETDQESFSDSTYSMSSAANEWKDPFEEFASRLQSRHTIESAQAFLRRMKTKFLGKSEGVHDVYPLLKRLFKKTPKSKLERYPTRIFLCAYMILNHPEVVFNIRGERESTLSACSKEMVEAFERMLQKCLQPSSRNNDNDQESGSDGGITSLSEVRSLSDLFNTFDQSWVAYLEQFVAWKSHDAANLAESLIKMAAKMQLSMLQKVEGDMTSERVRNNPDLCNIIQQVEHDHGLLRERVQRLAGNKGLQKFEKALADANEKYKQTSQQASKESSGSEKQESPKEESEGGSSSDQKNVRETPPPPPRKTVASFEEDIVSMNSGNEEYIWELLYDRNYQLPSARVDEIWAASLQDSIQLNTYSMTSQDAQSASEGLRKQINCIAEKAFWDSVEEKLSKEGADGAIQACTMLLEIGSELKESLPDSTSAKILKEHLKDEKELLNLLQGDGDYGLDTTRLLHLMDHTSDLLREFGSEARNEQALEAQVKIRNKIERALEVEEEGQKRVDLAKAITHALRLLHAQLKVLLFDFANVKIRLLSCSLTSPQAVHYIQCKFDEKHPLQQGQDPTEQLPQLKKWKEEIIEAQRSTKLAFQPFLASSTSARKTQVPTSMQSGLSGTTSSGSQELEQWLEVQYLSPVDLEDWRASFRIGLVNLVSLPLPLTNENVPETFILDLKRLHQIQNSFQRLMVMSASLIAVQQAKQSLKESLDNQELYTMKSRLSLLLESPSLNISSLTVELGRMAGSSEMEPLINSTLTNLTNRDKGGFKALSNSLTKAISFCLITTDSTDLSFTKEAIRSMLLRINSTFLVENVMEVAKELSSVIGVNEAVHEKIYQATFQQ